jgi:hypothetical protein
LDLIDLKRTFGKFRINGRKQNKNYISLPNGPFMPNGRLPLQLVDYTKKGYI